MIRTVLIKGLFAVLVMVVSCAVDASAQKVDCSARTDAEIVSSIYAKIKEKFPTYMRRVNVTSTKGVVTLRGWAAKKSIRSDIEKIAKKVACVKQPVKNSITIGVGGGCPPGTKKCGDICIPEDEECNIIVN
jgi:osmotically-inducible protein OsmY